MQPVGPTRIVLSPDALLVARHATCRVEQYAVIDDGGEPPAEVSWWAQHSEVARSGRVGFALVLAFFGLAVPLGALLMINMRFGIDPDLPISPAWSLGCLGLWSLMLFRGGCRSGRRGCRSGSGGRSSRRFFGVFLCRSGRNRERCS